MPPRRALAQGRCGAYAGNEYSVARIQFPAPAEEDCASVSALAVLNPISLLGQSLLS